MRNKYNYMEGLAKLALEFRDAEIYIHDLKSLSGYCQYCGARIRYEFILRNDEHEVILGEVCFGKLMRYLDMPIESVEKAIKFYKTYRELCEKAGVNPEAEIKLRELEDEVKRVKEIIQARMRENEERALKNADKIEFIRDRIFWLNKWEREFILEAEYYLTPKMENILNKIYDKVRNVSTDEVIRQVDARIKLEILALKGKYRIWSKAYEIIKNIYDREIHGDLKPLTDKQMRLIDKYFGILAKKDDEVRRRYEDEKILRVERLRSKIRNNGMGYHPWCSTPFPGWQACPLRDACRKGVVKSCEYPERREEYYGERYIYERW